MSIRWKIAILFMLVTFMPIFFLSRYAVEVFDKFTRTGLEEQMIDYAFIIGQEYRMELEGTNNPPPDLVFAERLSLYGHEVQTRLRLISTNGVVLFDSNQEEPTVGENVSHLHEIKRAMQGRYGARPSRTADGKKMYYYIALPVTNQFGLVAIANASTHTGPIVKMIIRMTKNYQIAMVISLLIAGVAAILLAYTMTYRLRMLTQASKRFARGESALKVDVAGKDEIGELGRDFSSMADEIGNKTRYNRGLLAETAHELMTPLTAIKGAAELLAQGAAEKPESRDKFLSNIQFESNRLIQMVEELSELTQLDAEDVRGRKEPIKYGAYLRGVVDRLLPAFDQPHAEIRLQSIDDEREVSLVPERIEQVVANLLENAIRYTPADGRINISATVDDAGNMVTIIEDTGKGIADSDILRVFDRFFSTEPKDELKEYGSGLGLAIARSIVLNHGGKIWVESEVDSGTRFYFSLPGKV